MESKLLLGSSSVKELFEETPVDRKSDNLRFPFIGLSQSKWQPCRRVTLMLSSEYGVVLWNAIPALPPFVGSLCGWRPNDDLEYSIHRARGPVTVRFYPSSTYTGLIGKLVKKEVNRRSSRRAQQIGRERRVDKNLFPEVYNKDRLLSRELTSAPVTTFPCLVINQKWRSLNLVVTGREYVRLSQIDRDIQKQHEVGLLLGLSKEKLKQCVVVDSPVTVRFIPNLTKR